MTENQYNLLSNNLQLEPLSARSEDLTGQTFSQLYIESFAGYKRNKKGLRFCFWKCRCTCGNPHLANTTHLKTGGVKSCGCRGQQKHGERRPGRTSPEYHSWNGIVSRCCNPNHHAYHRYSQLGVCRGIRESVMGIISIIGRKPDPKDHIDRIDNDLGYFCGQCEDCTTNHRTLNIRWLNLKDNIRNKPVIRVCLDGITKTLGEWAEEMGYKYSELYWRYKTGWPHSEKEALSHSRFSNRAKRHID